MPRLAAALLLPLAALAPAAGPPGLRVGFAEADVTPDLKAGPVYLAGFGQNRKATGVHDPIMVRAAVLADGTAKVALVSVDVVGLFLPLVEEARKELPGFGYVLVSATHNHEGPDTLGLWGPNPFTTGVDPKYLGRVRAGIVRAVKDADARLAPAAARLGTAAGPELLTDNRKPVVKHDELTALRFDAPDGTAAGVVLVWNCHPELLDDKNTLVSAEHVAATVAALKERHGCPVLYLTGTVGGLMTSLGVPVRDAAGRELKDGTFEKTDAYGRLVADLAGRALAASKPVALTPMAAKTRPVTLPVANKLYQVARTLGVFRREAFRWTGDPAKAEPLTGADGEAVAIRTEVGWLRLGDLHVAAVPAEIYPELVLGRVTDPAEAGADFPDAPAEPAVYAALPGPHKLLVGLANDEVGYVIPKRQWDEKAPFCYGQKKAPYGEINSLGPDTAALLCGAFRDLVGGK